MQKASSSASCGIKATSSSSSPLPTPDERLRLGLLRLGGVRDFPEAAGHEGSMKNNPAMIASSCLSVVDEVVEVVQAILIESKMNFGKPGRLQTMIYRSAASLRCLSQAFPILPDELMRMAAARHTDVDHAAREVPVPAAMTSEMVVRTMASSVGVIVAAQRTLRQGLEQGSPLEAVQASLEEARRAIMEVQCAAQRLLDAAAGPDLPLFTGGASLPEELKPQAEDDDTASESGSPTHVPSRGGKNRTGKRLRSPLLPLAIECASRLLQSRGVITSWLWQHPSITAVLVVMFLPPALCVAAMTLTMAVVSLPWVIALDVGLRHLGAQSVDPRLLASAAQAIALLPLQMRVALRRAAYWGRAEVLRESGPPTQCAINGWPASLTEAGLILKYMAAQMHRQYFFLRLMLAHLANSILHWAKCMNATASSVRSDGGSLSSIDY